MPRTIRATRHAVYANVRTPDGRALTFRVGRPVDWDTAQARWQRLDDRRLGIGTRARVQRVRFEGRSYPVETFEVRAVDADGVGLGSERHGRAMHVPYRTVRSAA